MTLDRVIFIGDVDFSPGLSYVALSRVRNVNGTLFEAVFPSERLSRTSLQASHQILPIRVETPQPAKKVPPVQPKNNICSSPVHASLNPPQDHNVQLYRPTFQQEYSFPMQPSPFKWFPVNEFSQVMLCEHLGLEFFAFYGCVRFSRSTTNNSINMLPNNRGRCMLILVTEPRNNRYPKPTLCRLSESVQPHSGSRSHYMVAGWRLTRREDVEDHMRSDKMREAYSWATETEIFAAPHCDKCAQLTTVKTCQRKIILVL